MLCYYGHMMSFSKVAKSNFLLSILDKSKVAASDFFDQIFKKCGAFFSICSQFIFYFFNFFLHYGLKQKSTVKIRKNFFGKIDFGHFLKCPKCNMRKKLFFDKTVVPFFR